MAEDRGCGMDKLTIQDFKGLHPAFDVDVMLIWNYERSIESRCSVGGTAKSSVLQQIELLRTFLTNKL